ncbi:hypothetical protein [Halobaculum limi]|uniref:hypothetical protein n=1 Tax=Halobaculum limi TaxID=3031916 RepID=UPI002406483F|nr:hypothetical protein [Halobaculum sp. YSMS11]
MSPSPSTRLRRVVASSPATVPFVAGVVCLLDGLAIAYREHAKILLSTWVDLSVVEWVGFLVVPFAVAPVGLVVAVSLLRSRWAAPGELTTLLPVAIFAVAVGHVAGQYLGMVAYAGATRMPVWRAFAGIGIKQSPLAIDAWVALIEPIVYDTLAVVAAVAYADASAE